MCIGESSCVFASADNVQYVIWLDCPGNLSRFGPYPKRYVDRAPPLAVPVDQPRCDRIRASRLPDREGELELYFGSFPKCCTERSGLSGR